MQHTGSQETSKRDARRLAVLFLAGGDGLAAHLAARWTRFLASGCLEIKAAGPGGTDLSSVLSGTPAGVVVVIHTPGEPGPLVVHNYGGRIDWDLGVDVTESPIELASQLRRNVMRLLGDLGMPQAHSDAIVMHSRCPSTVSGRADRLDARARLLAA